MAIEDILRALEDQAQADIDSVMTEADEHAKLIISEAEDEARRVHDHYTHQVEKVAEGKATKSVNAAKLESKMIVSASKGDGLQSVFDAARERLAATRDSGDYPGLFEALAREAFAGLEGDLVVHVVSDDAALATEVAAAAGVRATVVDDLQSAGGLIVEADGGRVIRRNTLEDRLDRARQLIESDVAKVLFA